MSNGQPADPVSAAEAVRRQYESSLSWRVTRPLRALKRRSIPSRPTPAITPPAAPRPDRYDSWLEHVHGEGLGWIEAACGNPGPRPFGLFRDLDIDLWALLLTQQYDAFPNIRALLPGVPDPALQEVWNGASGAELAAQSSSFYRKLTERYARHGDRPLAESRVLDFGCGWGRLTRFLARDVAPGSLYGCDPVEAILDLCRDTGVPATLARSDFVPERLPFDERFDLAFAFSVFTHISEATHQSCLRALHRSLNPGGCLIVTIRPPQYLHFSRLMRPALNELGADVQAPLDEPRYLFVPHPLEQGHLQYDGGDMTYGEAVVTMPYIRERWAPQFEVVDVDVLVGDLYQVTVTLRRT